MISKKHLTLLFVAFLCLSNEAYSASVSSEAEAAGEEKTSAKSGRQLDVPLEEDDSSVDAVKEDEASDDEPVKKEEEKYPYRDLPADVLRDFPGLCFGSTALRLFHIGQSWSLTPFCGVATCLVTQDRQHLIERVQDCGPQPLRNPKCVNINEDSDAPFPYCCPEFECEEGVELEYPTQEQLQQLAHEAAQAAVRAQYQEEPETIRAKQESDASEKAVEKSSDTAATEA